MMVLRVLRHALHVVLALALGLVLLIRGLQWYAASLDPSTAKLAATSAKPTSVPGASTTPAGPVALAFDPSAPPPDLIDFSPKKLKGAWAEAPWRQRHPFCGGAAPSPRPLDDLPPRAHWMDTCGFVPKAAEVTIVGGRFADPPARNSVFFGGVKAEVVRGDANRLVVRPHGGPSLSPIAVRSSGAPSDDAAPDRSTLPLPMTFVGPPHALLVMEGDGQAQLVGSRLSRIVVRVVDASGEGVPQERVWFWLRRRDPRAPTAAPALMEAITDALGLATALVTLPDLPGPVTIQAEAVNADESPERQPRTTITATAVPRDVDLAALVRDLGSADGMKRIAAARALGDMQGLAKSIVPNLLRLAGGDDLGVRFAALEALARIDADQALPLLVSDLQRDASGTRQRAAEILGSMGAAALPAAPALVAVFRTNRGPADYAPRVASLAALRDLRKAAGPAVPALVDALSDKDPWIRKTAAQALAAIGEPDAKPAEPALRRALEDERPDVRRAAKGALAAIGIWRLGQLRIFSGDDARVPLGQRAIVKARLTDEDGRPRPRETVLFSVVRGPGSLASWSATTDEGGVATATVVMGSAAGAVVVEARWETSAIAFHLASVDR